MEKILLCRLCLGTNANATFVSTAQLLQVELLLKKYNILFEVRSLCSESVLFSMRVIAGRFFQKRDLSTADGVNNILTQLCDLCWQKIDEFNQFCIQVENIQTSYNQQFLEDTTFDEPSQYFAEIEKIHNEFASKIYNNQIEDKKTLSYIEPFCMINVDIDVAKTASDSNQKSGESSIKELELLHIKEEHGPIDDDCNEDLNSTDVLNMEAMAGEMSDGDDDMSYTYEDEDEDDDDDDDNIFSSDTSESDSKEKKPKLTRKSVTKSKSSHKARKSSAEKSSKLPKKTSKKISVTTVNVLDEDNKRLLSYVQMKCDVCSDDRVFDSFAEIQTHFLDTHKKNGYIICCNRKFRRIGRVLQHCTW